jgi:hypothetical protein
MKVLCVAHPDDEVIWFNPNEFDKIIIVFGKRLDKPWMDTARINAIEEHPFREKIIFLNLTESGYWKNHHHFNLHQENYLKLISYFQNSDLYINNKSTEIFTHNEIGEYGHTDHILIHDVIKQIFYYQKNISIWTNEYGTPHPDKKIINTHFEVFYQIKNLYMKHKIWTWKDDYSPSPERCYRRMK